MCICILGLIVYFKLTTTLKILAANNSKIVRAFSWSGGGIVLWKYQEINIEYLLHLVVI